MAFKKIIKKLQKKYVMNHANNASLPTFMPSELKRQHFIFRGKVQGVGFRVEIYGIARRIDLSGWVRNNADGSVEAEMQGESDRIDYLVQYMKDLKRAEVSDVVITDCVVDPDDQTFELRM